METPVDWNMWKSSGAIYGTSDKRMLFWGKASRAKAPQTFPAIYANDFFLEASEPWISYSHVHDSLALPLEAKIPGRVEWQEPDFKRFENDFIWAKNKFKSGECTKIVLTTETRAEKKYAPDVFLENALSTIPKGTHLYGQWNGSQGFIGYTPEILFHLNNSRLQTMALAGTSDLSRVENDLYSDKNKREHQWVVDDLKTTLEAFGVVSSSELQTLKLETLAHLRTDIGVVVKESRSLTSWVESLHPTPALGTAPRKLWRQLQNLREGFGSFGAPFVVATSATTATAVVGIRQLAWDDKYYYIRCGCGVVEGSDSSDEWNELLLKIKSVKKRFGWLRE